MNTNKLITIGKPVAIATLVLGIIHVTATFTPLIQEGMACMDLGSIKAMTYMSLMCGGFLVLSGLILFMLLKKLGQFLFLILPILAISIFDGIGGILAVYYMFDNPFAWITLLLGLFMLLIAIMLKQKIKVTI